MIEAQDWKTKQEELLNRTSTGLFLALRDTWVLRATRTGSWVDLDRHLERRVRSDLRVLRWGPPRHVGDDAPRWFLQQGVLRGD